MGARTRELIWSEDGAAAAEYAILASLIAGAVAGAVTLFGETLRDTLFARALDILP